MQLLCANEQHAQALAAAGAARAAAPADADAAALHVLLLEASGRRAPSADPVLGQGLGLGNTPGPAEASGDADAAGAYMGVLRCDPSARDAVRGLLRLLAASGDAPPAAVAADVTEGCLLHLDICRPAVEPRSPSTAAAFDRAPYGVGVAEGPQRLHMHEDESLAEGEAEEAALEDAAWRALADSLEWCARADADAQEADSGGGNGGGGGSCISGVLEAASGTWVRLHALLGDRAAWWGSYHFGCPDRPPQVLPASGRSAAPGPHTRQDRAAAAAMPNGQAGAAAAVAAARDPVGLAARARVAAFVLGPGNAFSAAALAALQGAAASEPEAVGCASAVTGAQRLAALLQRVPGALRSDAEQCGATPSSTGRSGAPDGAPDGVPDHAGASGQRDGAEVREAHQWEAASTRGRIADPLKGGASDRPAALPGASPPGLGAVGADANHRRDGGRVAERVRYGEPSVKWGIVRQLPETWWTSFPQKRRRLREGP